VGRRGGASLRAAARRGWLALAGAVALLAPLMAQPVSQAGPIDPDAQTLARPKPKPAAKGTSTKATSSTQGASAQGQNTKQTATAQAGNAPAPGASAPGQTKAAAQGASQPSWSTQGGYKQRASTEGANAPGQKKAQAATAQTAATQAGANPPAQGASTQGANAQGSSQQGWSTQGQKPAPAAQIPLKPQADAQNQTETETPVFRSDVRLVRMLATVRDHAGALAGGLKREEFQITDSGVPQELAVFEATTEQPLSVAILIDCSASTYRVKRTELDSVRAFARSLFAGGNAADAAALYSFNAVITLEAGWTRSAERIERALGRLQSDGATALYDAITLSARDLTGRGGRHVVIVVTDGGDTFSKANYQQALEAAHLADAILYAVVIVPVVEDPGRNTGGEHALVAMAGSTGGRAFLPGTQKELDDAFGEILRDLRTQYLLAYYPRGVAATRDRFHEVQLALTRPGFAVTSRRGYFEPAPGKGFKVTPR
jgi:Ca-activated chloride channel family protein